MADDFDPNMWAEQRGYSAGAAPALKPLTYEQKVLALRQHMQNPIKTPAGQEGIMAPHSAGETAMAPVYGAAAAGFPGLAHGAGALAALLAGHKASEGAQMGAQMQNDALARHPVLGAIGGIVGGAVSPLTKAAGKVGGWLGNEAQAIGASPLAQHLARLTGNVSSGMAVGAAQGAGLGRNLDEAKSNAGTGAMIGGALPLAGAALEGGASVLSRVRPRIIDMYRNAGQKIMADKPNVAPYAPSGMSPGIGGPEGPTAMPKLSTSTMFRTKPELDLEAMRAPGEALAQMPREQAAVKQLVGPQHVNKRIGEMLAKPNSRDERDLINGIHKVGLYGGENQSSQTIANGLKKTMAAEGLGSDSPIHKLIKPMIGTDAAEEAARSVSQADSDPFRTGAAMDPGLDNISGQRAYLERLHQGEANRLGHPKMEPKPMSPYEHAQAQQVAGAPPVDSAKTGAGSSAADLGGVGNPGAPRPMVERSEWAGTGQPISKVQFSGFDPEEAMKFGNAANDTMAINLGRQNSPLAKASQWLKPAQGMVGKLKQPVQTVASMALDPSNLETAAGAASKAGDATRSAINMFDKWIPPNSVISAFTTAHLPKDSEENQDSNQ